VRLKNLRCEAKISIGWYFLNSSDATFLQKHYFYGGTFMVKYEFYDGTFMEKLVYLQ